MPEELHLRNGDYLHVEISGSDTNPNNNDGQGRQGTDRSNICPMKNENYVGGKTSDAPESVGAQANNYPAYVVDPTSYSIPVVVNGRPRELLNDAGQVVTDDEGNTQYEEVICRTPDHYSSPIGGMDGEVAAALCTGRQKGSENMDYGNMEELDDAGTAVHMDPIQMKQEGCWNYVSTRNNNFSNRSQKGRLCVDSGAYAQSDVGYNGGAVMTDAGWIAFNEGSLDTIYSVTFATEPQEDGAASPTVVVNPPELTFAEGESAEVGIDYTHRALKTPHVMHKRHDSSSWNEVSDVEYVERDGKTVAVFSITESGSYKVEDSLHGGAVAAIVVIGLIFMCTLGTLAYFKFKGKSAGQDMNTALQSPDI